MLSCKASDKEHIRQPRPLRITSPFRCNYHSRVRPIGWLAVCKAAALSTYTCHNHKLLLPLSVGCLQGKKNTDLAKQQSACKTLCNACASQCAGKSGPLPKTCQDGMNAVKGVQSSLQECLSEYQAARAKGQSALEQAMKEYQAGC